MSGFQMESAIYSMYLVDIRNLVRNKLNICKEYHVQPSEIDRMPFYEYEYMLEEIRKDMKEQEKQQKEQEKQQEAYKSSLPNYNKMMSGMSGSLPKFSMPKL